MRVGLLTSWRTACGVAQYSRALAEAFHARDDTEIVILAPEFDSADRYTPDEPVPFQVEPVFKIGHWRRDGEYAIDVDAILKLDLDVVHAQYQSMLLNQDQLGYLATRLSGVPAVTFHDSCNRPDFPAHVFDVSFTHRAGVGPATTVIPFGVRDLPPIVRTFGLGRTIEPVVREVCDRNGWIFETAATSEAAQGGQRWMPWRELHDWLRGADAIVLFYPEQPMAGSSQAARTALATRRPVIVNDTTWFRGLEDRAGNLHKVAGQDHLEWRLRELFNAPTEHYETWDTVAGLHVEAYRAVIDRRASQRAAEAPQSPNRIAA